MQSPRITSDDKVETHGRGLHVFEMPLSMYGGLLSSMIMTWDLMQERAGLVRTSSGHKKLFGKHFTVDKGFCIVTCVYCNFV